MAVKTITIDIEAYNLLASEKMAKESFSKVIKRRLKPVHTADNLLRNLDKIMLSDSTLDKTEELIRARKESMANSPVIEKE
ncbi:MAG: antitoxin VapB family protein [Candidatus Euphemobacter frigidus]|nr:antitoxin VapB family protein [Candidatus Euphemobacter frigidus]MDP8275310.1 antitoxin VapB family protein [Candidatus Euphemobacter frigidus]